MKYSIVLPILIAFVISAVLGPLVIPMLHKLKFGSIFVRKDRQVIRKSREHRRWAASFL